MTLKAFVLHQRYHPLRSDTCSGNWRSRLRLLSTPVVARGVCVRFETVIWLNNALGIQIESGSTLAIRVAFDSQLFSLTFWSTFESVFSLRQGTSSRLEFYCRDRSILGQHWNFNRQDSTVGMLIKIRVAVCVPSFMLFMLADKVNLTIGWKDKSFCESFEYRAISEGNCRWKFFNVVSFI